MPDWSPERWGIRARWVLPIASPPIQNGIVTVRGTTIESVGLRGPDVPVWDVGRCIVLPALINTHTHLEFSQLRTPLSPADRSFATWLEAVVHYRRNAGGHHPLPHNPLPQDSSASVDSPIVAGVRELHAHGTCCVGEIATQAYPPPKSLDGIAFHEVLCLRADRAAEAWQGLLQRLKNDGTSTDDGTSTRDGLSASWQPGISPHSPYTLRQDLFERVVRHAAQENLPVAMHLAESRDEMQILRDHQGPLRTLFDSWGVWDPTAFATGTRPLDYLRCLADVRKALVVHANYLDDAEMEFLAAHRQTLSVVHCPRTHAFFAHDRNPLRRLLAAGVRVVLGTDSRSSNPDLSLWEELRYLARTHPDLPAETLLAMGTRDAAEALGLHRLGTLSPGQLASLIVVDAGPHVDRDPYSALLASESAIEQFYWRGERVV